MLNFACSDESLHKSSIARISDVFPCVACMDIPQEVYEVIFASKSRRFTLESEGSSDTASVQKTVLQTIHQSAKRLDRAIPTVSKSCNLDLAECIADLQVLSVK